MKTQLTDRIKTMIKAFMLLLSVLFFGCGSDDNGYKKKGGGNLPTDQVWTGSIKPILDKHCKRCHSTSAFIFSGAAYKGSSAKQRIASTSNPMPPIGSGEAASLTQQQRSVLINY
jgi:hypothetical protein